MESLRIDVPQPHTIDELPGTAALWVNQHLGFGKGGASLVQNLRPDSFVHVALSHPDLDAALGPHPSYVAPQEKVGEEEDADVSRYRIDHVEHVPTGAAVVELGLYLRRGIDVSDRYIAGK